MLYWMLRRVLGPIGRLVFRPVVTGGEHVPTSGAAILASNHLSFFDSILLPMVLQRRITFPAKMEYFTGKGPTGRLTRAFFVGTGQIPIDRSGGAASASAIEAGLQVLGRGELFGIYPEGTRSPDGRLHKGKTGMVRMAIEAGVPIIPVAMIDTDKAQPTGQRIPKAVQLGVRFGAPVHVEHLSAFVNDRRMLRAAADEIMYALAGLSGQEYVDEYASTSKKPLAARPANPAG